MSWSLTWLDSRGKHVFVGEGRDGDEIDSPIRIPDEAITDKHGVVHGLTFWKDGVSYPVRFNRITNALESDGDQ